MSLFKRKNVFIGILLVVVILASMVTIQSGLKEGLEAVPETDGFGPTGGRPLTTSQMIEATSIGAINLEELTQAQMDILQLKGEEELQRQLFEEKFKGNPREFVKLRFFHVMNKEMVRSVMSQEDASELRSMLADPLFTEDWSNVVTVLGYIDPSEETADALLDHLKRPFDFTLFTESDPDQIGY